MFPLANRFWRVPLATVVAPEIIRAPAPAAVVENPTETPPAPEIEKLVRVCVVDDDTVVFPIANSFCTTPLAADVAPTIRVFDEYPTVTIPDPETEIASGRAEDVEEDTVVLPTANRLRLP